MTYSLETERTHERDWCVEMVTKGGYGWDAFVIDRAAKLAKADPLLHRELPGAVRKAIEARKASQLQPQETQHAV
jgi:hypothetical protein